MIVYWQAVWEIIADFVASIEHKYGIKKWKVYALILMAVIVVIEFHPKFLEKV